MNVRRKVAAISNRCTATIQLLAQQVSGMMRPAILDTIRSQWRRGLIIAVFTMAIVSVYLYWHPPSPAFGATYLFTQTDWSGGTTSNTMVHPTNESGWTQYTSASTISASSSLALTTSTPTASSRNDITTNSSGDMYASNMAMDANGVLHLVYFSKEYNSASWTLAYRRSTDGGATWSARTDISTSTISLYYIRPAIVIDHAGRVFIAYTNNGVYLARSLDGGSTWSYPTAISGTSGQYPSLTIDNANAIYVVYNSIEGNGTNNIALHKSIDNGVSWSSRVDITTSSYAATNADIASDGTNLYVYYSSYEYTTSTVNGVVRYSSDGGATWSARSDITASSQVNTTLGSLAVDSNDTIHLVYETNTGYYNYNYRHSTDGGKTWSTQAAVTSGNPGIYANMKPKLLVDSSENLHVVYYSKQFNTNVYNVAYVKSTDLGTTWSSFYNITASASIASQYPSAIVNTSGTIDIAYFSKEQNSSINNMAYRSLGVGDYTANGSLISSPYDSGDASNRMAQLSWDETVPANSSVIVSLRTGSSTSTLTSASWTDFTDSTAGCTVSSGTVTCPSAAIPTPLKDGSGDRWWEYKITLKGNTTTPSVSEIRISYVINAAPEVRNVTALQQSNGTVTISYNTRDSDTNTGSATPGYITPSFEYWNGSTFQPITALVVGDTANKAVTTSTWTTYTATWTPSLDFPSHFMNGTAQIRVTVNDNEPTNNTAQATSTYFTLDTKAPTNNSITVDASQSPALVTVSSTDDSQIFMRLAVGSIPGGTYATSTATTTISVAAPQSTVYAQFKDAYNNESSVVSATTPETPTAFMVQDTSNVNASPADYRLFLAWKTVALPGPGFGSYKLYRSTDQQTWSLIATINDRLTNYYTDANVTANALYYYRLTTVDAAGNISFNSATANGKPNGVQDAGEGGGGIAVSNPPVISNVTTTALTPQSATISWNTDILSDSTVGYSSAPSSFSTVVHLASMVDNSQSVGPHTISLSNLTPNTTYYYQVQSATISATSTTDNNAGPGYSFTTPNGISISGTSNPIITNTTATVVWNTSAPGDSYVIYSTSSDFTYSVASGAPTLISGHSVTLTGLTAGAHYFYYVQSTDQNGIVATDKNVIGGSTEYYSFTTTLDVTPPSISNISSSNITDSGAVITWDTDKLSDSQVEYGISTAYGLYSTRISTTTIQHTVTLVNLTSSTQYHFRVHSQDVNDNAAVSGDSTFTTAAGPDTVAPLITGVATSSVSLTRATITWDTNESANGLVEFSTDHSFGTVAGDASLFTTSSHAVTIYNLTGNTTYYFRIRSTDTSGNQAVDDNHGAGYSFVTLPDTTPPTISQITAALVSDTSAIITWTTNELADSQVYYGTSNAYGSATVATDTYTSNHVITLTGLDRNTTYYYKVASADASSNVTTDDNNSAGYTFTTTFQPSAPISCGGGGGGLDRQAPTILNLKIKTDGKNIIVDWDTSKIASSLVQFGLTNQYGLLTGNYNEKTITHHVTVSPVQGGGVYHIRAVSIDEYGNIGQSADQPILLQTAGNNIPEEPSQWLDDNVITSIKQAPKQDISQIMEALVLNPALKDIPESTMSKALTEMANKTIAAPTIVGTEPQVEVRGTTALIRWSTNKKSSSSVAYAPDSEYAPKTNNPYSSMASNPNEMTTEHEVALGGLNPGTRYHFQVSSQGLVGPEGKSTDYTFTTASTLPEITNVNVQKIDGSIVRVNWDTNIPTAGTLEFTNQKSNHTETQSDPSLVIHHSFTISNLLGGAGYTIRTKAVDAFGSEAISEPLNVFTPRDTTPPVISNVTANSTIFPGKDSKVQTIISWDTDEPATAQVFYRTGAANTVPEAALPLDSSFSNHHLVVITAFSPGSVYRFRVEDRDSAGNVASSDNFSILTPREKQTVFDVIVNNFNQVFGWTKKLNF